MIRVGRKRKKKEDEDEKKGKRMREQAMDLLMFAEAGESQGCCSGKERSYLKSKGETESEIEFEFEFEFGGWMDVLYFSKYLLYFYLT